MFEALQYGFMQRALIAGLLTAVAASYYGVFVVQRGMSFLGNGLAHATFGGV
ncbi:metal ABC transporter permease, partial [bacterium]|nr:metal ABC transporter permease [bacterium]